VAEMIKAFNEALTKLNSPPGPRAAKTSTIQGRFGEEARKHGTAVL